MSLSRIRPREDIVNFLKSNPVESKEIEEQAAKRVDKLLELNEGYTLGKAIKLKEKMQAQQKGRGGYVVTEGEFPTIFLRVLDEKTDDIIDVEVPDHHAPGVIDTNKCHQLDFLHYLLYFFVFSYYSLASNLKKRSETAQELQITAGNLLTIHINEIWIIVNAYLIRKKYSEIIKEEKMDEVGSKDEMHSFISSMLDQIIAGSEIEFEYCVPAGSPRHAVYLTLMYKRQPPGNLTIRVDNPSREKPILFNCGDIIKEEKKSRDQVIQYLEKVFLNMKVGPNLDADAIKIINNEVSEKRRFSFKRIEDKDANYPLRSVQSGPNCVWHGFVNMGQWYRLCRAGKTYDGRVYSWFFKSIESFHNIEIKSTSTFEDHQKMWSSLYSLDVVEIIKQEVKRLCQKQYTGLPQLLDFPVQPIEDIFVNLNIILESKHQKSERQIHKSDIDENEKTIYTSETQIDWYRLFAPQRSLHSVEDQGNYKRPRRVLITGSAGIGKSSLSHYLAFQWARELKEAKSSGSTVIQKNSRDSYVRAWQKEWDIVWLLPLHQLHRSKKYFEKEMEARACSYGHDLLFKSLYHICLDETARKKLDIASDVNMFVEQCKKFNSNRILLILDGYDELVNFLEATQYLKDILITALSDLTWHVILTTRHYAISTLPPQAKPFDQRLEIVGFTDQGIEEYIKRSMARAFPLGLVDEGYEGQPNELIGFLKSNYHTWESMRIPIHLAIVTAQWLAVDKDKKIQLLNPTLLYQEMVRSLLQHSYSKEQENNRGNNRKKRRKQIEKNIEPDLRLLSQLAFLAMKENTFFIPQEDLKKAISEVKDKNISKNRLLKTGLLQGTLTCPVERLDKPISDRSKMKSHTVYIYRDNPTKKWSWVFQEEKNHPLSPQFIQQDSLQKLLNDSPILNNEIEQQVISEIRDHVLFPDSMSGMLKDCHFAHSSFQEYLTAFFLKNSLISSSKNQQDAIIFIQEHRHKMYCETVFIYLAGLLSLEKTQEAFDIFWNTIAEHEGFIRKNQARLLLRCWEASQVQKADAKDAKNLEGWQLNSRVPHEKIMPFLTRWMRHLVKEEKEKRSENWDSLGEMKDPLISAFHRSPLVFAHQSMTQEINSWIDKEKEHGVAKIAFLMSFLQEALPPTSGFFTTMFPLLEKMSDNEEGDIRAVAARCFAALTSHPKIFPMLKKLSNDEESNVRAAAVKSLTKLALITTTKVDKICSVLDLLKALIKDSKEKNSVRIAVAKGLTILAPVRPDDVFPLLEELIQNPKEEYIRIVIAEELTTLIATYPDKVFNLFKILNEAPGKHVGVAIAKGLSTLAAVQSEVFPELKRLSESKEGNVRAAAAEGLIALAFFKSDEVFQEMKKLSKDPMQSVRIAVGKGFTALASVSPDKAFDLLEALIKDREEKRKDLRAVAVKNLTAIAYVHPDKVFDLFNTLIKNRKEDNDIRAIAVKELPTVVFTYPDKAFDLLKKLIENRDEDKNIRSMAVQGLVAIMPARSDKVFDLFKTLIGDQEEDRDILVAITESLVVSAFAKSGPEKAFDLFDMLRKNPEEDVRIAIAKGLSILGAIGFNPSKIFSSLENLGTMDIEEGVRIAAVTGCKWLASICPDQTLRFLEERLKRDQIWNVRVAAVESLTALTSFTQRGDYVCDLLIKALREDPKKGVRAAAAKSLITLASISPEKVFNALKETLRSRDRQEESIYLAAVESLVELASTQPERVFPLLEELKKGSEESINAIIAEGLKATSLIPIKESPHRFPGNKRLSDSKISGEQKMDIAYEEREASSEVDLSEKEVLDIKIENKEGIKKVILAHVIDSFGYNELEQQIALTKLAIFTGCFRKKHHNTEAYIGRVISDKSAEHLLNCITFDSFQEGIQYWVEETQIAWFRRNQYLRHVGYKKDNNSLKNSKKKLKSKSDSPSIPLPDTDRWIETGESEISEFIEELKYADFIKEEKEEKEKKEVEYNNQHELTNKSKLKKIFRYLGLSNPVEFEEIEITKHLVIHGGKEDLVKECIKFINTDLFTGYIYYATNPRFLFNDENSIAFIIARWFNKTNKIREEKIRHCIQEILQDENRKGKGSQRNWTKNLPELKNDILARLKERNLLLEDDTWPMDKGWYYREPSAYERNAELNGLKYSPAGWPTAVDMVEYWLHRHFKKKINCITLCPVYPDYSLGHKRIIATTEDTVRAWYRKHGQYLPSGTSVAFVSSNLRLHYILYQDRISKEILRREQEALSPLRKLDFEKIKTVGPGAQNDVEKDNGEFCFRYGIDALAKTMYFSSQSCFNFLFFNKKKANKFSAGNSESAKPKKEQKPSS